MKNQKMLAVLGISLLLVAIVAILFTLTSEGNDSENSSGDTTTQPTHITTDAVETTEQSQVNSTEQAIDAGTQEAEQAAVATQQPVTTTAVPAEQNIQNSPSGNVAPTATPTIQAVTTATPLPTAEPTQITIPVEPVENQVVIQFDDTASEDERSAYLETIAGLVIEDIPALNTVIVRIPDNQTLQTLPESPIIAETEPDHYVVALEEPNDPHYASQWALPVIGAPQAWENFPANAPLVTVAVIDTGVCADHPDLQRRVLTGYDFVDDDTNANDESGHGCAVAGIIAANTDNTMGIAGIAPNARILPIRVLNAQGVGTTSDVAAAIIYAADNGAQVINLSLGGHYPSAVMENAVNYASNRGVLVIASSGNSGTQGIKYPAAYPNAIAVGSIDPNLQQSSFTSYGPQLDGLAPGRDILSTGLNAGYTTKSGTSFAAPQVAGLATVEIAYGRTLVTNGSLIKFIANVEGSPTATLNSTQVSLTPTYSSTEISTTPTPSSDSTATIHPKISSTVLSEFYILSQSMSPQEAKELVNWPALISLEADKIYLEVTVERGFANETCNILTSMEIEVISCGRVLINILMPINLLLQVADITYVKLVTYPSPEMYEKPINQIRENELTTYSNCPPTAITNAGRSFSKTDLWNNANYDGTNVTIAILGEKYAGYGEALACNEVPVIQSVYRYEDKFPEDTLQVKEFVPYSISDFTNSDPLGEASHEIRALEEAVSFQNQSDTEVG